MSAADVPTGVRTGGADDRTQTLLVLGARGDLASRLLLPGLGGLIAASSLSGLLLVGSDRGEGSDEEWRTVVAEAFAAGGASGPAVDAVVRDARYVAADATDENDLRRLLEGRRGRLTLYFALPPAVTVEACRTLSGTGVPDGTRLVGVILAALQQFCGINTILYYAPTIMGEAGLSASRSIYYSVFIGVVNVIVTIVSVYLVDRIGRRPLLLLSLVGMGVSIALLGVAFSAELDPVLMLVFMLLYIVAFGVGMGPVFWVLLGELFPPAQRAEGSSAGSTVNWLSNFVVSLLFLPLIQAIGHGPTFWIFAVICVLGVAFVARWVPGTRGRHADEVGEDLRRRWNAPAT
ncbi:MFS transporter [Streptomyces prasinus]